MTQKTKQEQVLESHVKPAPAGTAEPPKGRVDSKAAVVELTDAELQAVSGGGCGTGMGGDISR